MHEYSIVASLVERVEREAVGFPGAVVRRLHVRIGELAGVEIELLRTAYETFRAHTICDATDLCVDRVAARWECPHCGFVIATPPLRCTSCDRPAHLAAGDEIILDRIELEVPDV